MHAHESTAYRSKVSPLSRFSVMVRCSKSASPSLAAGAPERLSRVIAASEAPGATAGGDGGATASSRESRTDGDVLQPKVAVESGGCSGVSD